MNHELMLAIQPMVINQQTPPQQSFKRELLSTLKKREWRHASKNPKLCLCFNCWCVTFCWYPL